MKALSVRQPWAYLIASGEKTIELRSWKTDYRGKLLICASKSEKDAWVLIGDNEEHQLPAGVMMCTVDLVDVIPLADTEENRRKSYADKIAEGTYGWVLANPQDVLLKPVNGRLRLFEVDDGLIEPMPDEDSWFDHSDKLAVPGMKCSGTSVWVKYD